MDPRRFTGLAAAIELAQDLERQAVSYARPAAPGDTPWMPSNLFDFGEMVLEAIPLIPQPDPDTPPRFLDVGAGPGSKMVLAREFGMDVHGIEAQDALAAMARACALDVQTADVRDWEGFGEYDVIWLNRPLRDPVDEAKLEAAIQDAMQPGTVILCANLEFRPPEAWIIISDSWQDNQRGAFIKPYGRT